VATNLESVISTGHVGPVPLEGAVLCRHAALEAFDPARTRLVNYQELPEAVWSSLPAHLGVTCTAEEIESMRSASRFNAKSPDRPFVPDSDHKRNLATPELRAAVEEWLKRDYERLESIRLSQMGSDFLSR